MERLADQLLACFASGATLTRRDIPPLSSYDTVGRSLAKLVQEGRLVRIGRGLFRIAGERVTEVSSMPLNVRIAHFIERSEHVVFMRSDFSALGDDSAVGRVLRNMVQIGSLIRLGRGLYAQAKKTPGADSTLPVMPVEVLIAQAARRLGMTILPFPSETSPGKLSKRARISRRIGHGMHFAFLGD